jgi:hypothetical protein
VGGSISVSNGGTTTQDSAGGTENSTGGSTAGTGGAEPISTGGSNAGGTEPVSTGGSDTGGTEPVSTGGSNAGGTELVSTGGSDTGGTEPVGTGGSNAGGTEPVSTGGSGPIGAGGSNTGGSEPISSGGSNTGGSPEGGASAGQLAFTANPVFTSNDNLAVPQVGIVRFATNVAVTGTISVSGGDEAWTVQLGAAATAHEATILGLKADTTYQVTISASDGAQELISPALEWHTPMLPADFPRLEFLGSDPGQMEPGMTLFNVRGPYYLIVVDNVGQVRWYYTNGKPAENDHRLLTNGHLIFPSSQREITEIDWRGNVVSCWYAKDYPYSFAPPVGAIPVSAQTFHHSVREMPNGNLLALTTETRTISNYPTSTTDPNAGTRTARVTGDVVVEFTRTGEIVKRIALLDILDPTRVGYSSTDASWIAPGAKDWSHSNSAVYDAASNAYVVSSRHQDAVIKIDRETESLVWILGTHSNWSAAWQDKLLRPVGDLTWQYHQHAADFVPGASSVPGTIVLGLFDNGNNRAAAFETPQTQYSRAVSYAIDEQQMTVTQLWSYGAESGPDFFYSMSMSDADWQPTTGNVLITAGRLQTTDAQGGTQDYSRILEVTATGTSVFEMFVRADLDTSTDYTTFNGKRIADLRSSGFGQD